MYCKVTWFLHNLRWRVYTLFQRKKERVANWIHVHRTKLKWIYNLTGQECTHGTVMYCYPVVLGIFTIWLPRFDSHRTEQSSRFSVTQKIICSWPTLLCSFTGKCPLPVARWWAPAGMALRTCHRQLLGRAWQRLKLPGSRDLNLLSSRSALRQVISDRWNQPRFSAFPAALAFWEEQRIPLEKIKSSHCREDRAQQFGFGIVSRGAVYDHAACRSACVICPTPLSSTEQFKTHPTERQRARREKGEKSL